VASQEGLSCKELVSSDKSEGGGGRNSKLVNIATFKQLNATFWEMSFRCQFVALNAASNEHAGVQLGTVPDRLLDHVGISW
jgi:hypothetical protein